jgi:hypothetical protein
MGKSTAGVASPAGAPLQRRDLNAGRSTDAHLKQHAAGVKKRSGATPPAALVAKQLATPKTAPAASRRPDPATQPKTHQRRKSGSALAAARSPTSAKQKRLASPPSGGRSPRTPRSKQGTAGEGKAGKAAAPLAAVQSPSTGRQKSAAKQCGEQQHQGQGSIRINIA